MFLIDVMWEMNLHVDKLRKNPALLGTCTTWECTTWAIKKCPVLQLDLSTWNALQPEFLSRPDDKHHMRISRSKS